MTNGFRILSTAPSPPYAGLAFGTTSSLQHRVGGGHVVRRQAEFAADDVAALRDGARLVERDLAVAALAAEAAVARDDQLLGGMYSSALRISPATSSGRSACSARWLTAPMRSSSSGRS